MYTFAHLAWELNNQLQSDSAIYFYECSLKLAISYQNRPLIANVKFNLGGIYDVVRSWDLAVLNYKSALTIYESLADLENAARVSIYLSLIFKNHGLYDEALEQALNSARLLEQGPSSLALASSYSTISRIYAEVGDINEELVYAIKAHHIFIHLKDNSSMSKSYNNLGDLHTRLHSYDSATTNLLKSIAIKRELNDTKGLGRTINNLGKVAMLTGNNSEAEQHFNESLKIEKSIDDPVGMIEVLNNLGELYIKTHHHPEASKALNDAQVAIQKAQSPDHLRQNLELQIKLAQQQNDFKKGMLLLEDLLVLRDSLLSQEKAKSLQALRIRYETEKKAQQITLLEQQEEISKAKIRNSQILVITLVIGLILVAAIGILIYLNLRNARAVRARIELLLAETRHRIKNNLQTLASIFHLQTRHYTDQEMVLEARTSESRVHAMSMLHERFYAAEADHTVNTKTYITDLIHKLVDIYGWRTRDLHLSVNVDDLELDIDKALALSLIIQELVCNAFKYAFDHEPEPALSVTLRSDNMNILTSISDNGIGLNEEAIGTSQGFGLVEALVSQLDGTMEIVKRDGTTFIITFPQTQPWKNRLF